ncbi:hypothetical protein [Streptodolium elevatio]|uniref:Uncharacterized protein n=1 Tax=Streptodolium elevatio TaxID=3157996 RepID=A0ABV3DBY2_9ACTN
MQRPIDEDDLLIVYALHQAWQYRELFKPNQIISRLGAYALHGRRPKRVFHMDLGIGREAYQMYDRLDFLKHACGTEIYHVSQLEEVTSAVA